MLSLDSCYINGKWSAGKSGQTFALINPATEVQYGTLSLADRADVDAAVLAARKAFHGFSQFSKSERIELLKSVIACLTSAKDELADAITQELGAPRNVDSLTNTSIDAFKQAITTLQSYEFERIDGINIIRREPIGVCGLITAWNWPAQLIATKVSMAIAAGCTTVVKPSEYTPGSATVIAKVLHKAGVPEGVFNLVIGDGPTVGNAICQHPDIDFVSFTGSTRAGIMVAEAAAPTVKRVTQELGGKSANIVLPEADLAAAAKWNVSRAFTNSGQSCHAPTRILIHQRQLDEFLCLLEQAVTAVRVGRPLDPNTTMGPLINKAQFERVQSYIQIGLDEGATLLCGGPGRPDGLEQGYYVKPTIFYNVTTEMTIAQEEIFGPVICVLVYRDEAEALEIANGTLYGLGGYVFAGDVEHGRSVAKKIRAGRVFLNGSPSNTAAPMGGYKRSGNGREMGVFGLEEYLEVKAMFGFV